MVHSQCYVEGIFKCNRILSVDLTKNTVLFSQGPDSRYGTKGQRKVVVNLPEGCSCFREDNSGDHKLIPLNKLTFSFAYVAGQNNGTSVEDGQIPEIIFYT